MAARRARRTSRSAGGTALALLVLLLALLLRVPVALRNPMPAGDGIASNLEMARHVLGGDGFSTLRKWTLYDDDMSPLRPEANRQPVMSLLLAGVFTIAGVGFLQAQAVALISGLLCLAAFWVWARRVFGTLPALLALAVMAVHPVFVWYSAQPDSLMLYTAIVFAVLALADRCRLSPGRAVLLGTACGIGYLTRTQGLFLAFSVGLWLLLRGGRRRFALAAAFSAVFLAACSPWLVRNYVELGSPTYSQNSQFLLNENHWAAWEVRDTAPAPGDMLEHQGAGAVVRYVAAGVLRVLEPFISGTLHRGEVFGFPPLVGFAVLGLLALRRRGIRRAMELPLLVALPVLMVLVLHEHSSRYLAFLSAMVVALGCSGLARLSGMAGRGVAAAAALLLMVPFLRPIGGVLAEDSRMMRAEAQEVSDWLELNSGTDDRVVTFPNVELLIWDYMRPTLTMPNDYEMLLWPALEEHGVRYVVVDGDLPTMRPHLSDRWRRTVDGTDWALVDPPAFLERVYRSDSGFTLVYEMTAPVPEGFMAVDSLPRDNLRALPPG